MDKELDVYYFCKDQGDVMHDRNPVYIPQIGEFIYNNGTVYKVMDKVFEFADILNIYLKEYPNGVPSSYV